MALCLSPVLIAGAIAVTVLYADRGAQTHSPGRQSAARALAAAATARQQAAAWIAAQVSPSAIVSCDPVMCGAIQAHGFPSGDLLVLHPNASDPLGSAIVVSTAATRSQFGGQLASVYAPDVIASFGTGPAMVQVRVIAPDGAAAYRLQQTADRLALQASGQQLANNRNMHVSGAARRDLTAGMIDPRLLVTLAALADSRSVHVAGFSDQGPGAGPAVPYRAVEISAGESSGQQRRSATYLNWVLSFLRAQNAQFRPGMTVLGKGSSAVIHIQFDAPSPLALPGGGSS